MSGSVAPLVEALAKRERMYRQALDVFDGDEPSHAEIGAHRALVEAVRVTGCLRRLAERSSVEEIHRAFGAPGDFGYETDIGAALAKVYGVKS